MRNRKTHCVNGHAFEPDNVYYDTLSYRHCKRCKSLKSARYYQKRLKNNQTHQAKNREKGKKYYALDPDKFKQAVKQYWLANPGKRSIYTSRRRARKAGNGGSHTLQERVGKFAALGNVCYYCGCDGPLTVDHDIPIARGGTDNIDNILPACSSCNYRKHTRTAQEFIICSSPRKSLSISA